MLKNNIISEEFKNLNGQIDILKNKYLQEDPFPNILLKNFFNQEFLDKIIEEFPDLSKNKNSENYKNKNEMGECWHFWFFAFFQGFFLISAAFGQIFAFF